MTLNELWSWLSALTTLVEEMSNALKQFLRYSYQYNIKIIGLPETNVQESASETSVMCLNLFKAVGVNLANHDMILPPEFPPELQLLARVR